jgi:hypothetical protein
MIMPATGAMLATYLPGPDYFCRILNEWCIFWKYTFPLRGVGGYWPILFGNRMEREKRNKGKLFLKSKREERLC